jgi:simple sugar transport system permease protein
MIDFIVNFLASDIRTATPLLLAALGLVYSERSGIVNIGTEGIMLTGALLGTVGSYYSGSVWIGTLLAVSGCMLLSLVFSFFTVTLKADQTVVGTALNIFAGGFTITLNRLIFGGSTTVPVIDVYDKVPLPILSKIPYVGEVLFHQSLPVYIAFLCVPLAWFVLNKSNIGLKVRAVGENPKACDTVGINVFKIRYGAILFSGAMSGLAGSFISMGQLNFFTEGMVAGRGFMALAVCVFGNYSPIGVLLASLLFGASEALQYRLQAMNSGIPYQFLVMLPYVITVIALCMLVRKSNKPACSAIPYSKE